MSKRRARPPHPPPIRRPFRGRTRSDRAIDRAYSASPQRQTTETRRTRDTGDVSRRRACLVVPAAPSTKLAKGTTLIADEVVLDLEDAVVPAVKDDARTAVAAALGGEGQGGGVG